MKANSLYLTIAAVFLAGTIEAQQQGPVYYQTINCIKVRPGKGQQYLQFVQEATKKVAESRVKAGEINSWALLRSVMPAGEEARCGFMISTMSEGAPREVRGMETLAASLEKAGVKMTAAQYIAKRDELTYLVSTEMWRPRIRVGTPQKGNYLFLNYMKVHSMADYIKFENEVWKPMAEEWVKEGSQSGWLFTTAVLPGGTDVKYAAMSADIFPNWDAAFKVRPTADAFKKAHPGKDQQATLAPMNKLRDLALRQLLYIEERVGK